MLKSINKNLHTPLWLSIIILIVIIARIPTLFEPYAYGDEMIYLALGEAVHQDVPLYKGIHDNKPPLLYLTAALSGSLFWFRAILMFWHVITIYIFWKFVEYFYPKNIRLQKVSVLIFSLLTTLPFLEGNISNSEMFMLGPTLLGFYFLLAKKLTKKNLLASGAILSIATLFKMPGLFDVPAIVIFWLFTQKLNFKSFKTTIINSIYLAIGYAVPIVITFIWYYFQGAFQEYLIAAFLQNVGYLSSFRPDDVQEPFLVKNGPLLMRGFIMLIGLAILFIKRKSLSKPFLFMVPWLLLTMFATALSERPYPHYLVQAIPPFTILMSMLFTLKTMEQVLVIFPLTVAFLVPVRFDFWYYSSAPYYETFYKFASGEITKEEYFNSFGGNTVRNYQVSEYVASITTKDDNIFVWGNSSTIYALSERLPPIRYVADYHIKDFSSEEEVMNGLMDNPPKAIVILPDSNPFIELLRYLDSEYRLLNTIQNSEIYIRKTLEI